MKMTRRSLLKLLPALPFIAPIVAKALTPKPATKAVGHFDTDFKWHPQDFVSKSRGKLFVMVDGDITLAQLLASRHRLHVISNPESLADPLADCDFLTARGVSVILMTKLTKSGQLFAAYGGNVVGGLFTAYGSKFVGGYNNQVELNRVPDRDFVNHADWIFYIRAWGMDRSPDGGPKNMWWTGATLKDRSGEMSKIWTWNTGDRNQLPNLELPVC